MVTLAAATLTYENTQQKTTVITLFYFWHQWITLFSFQLQFYLPKQHVNYATFTSMSQYFH